MMLGRAGVILFALVALTAAAGPPPASSAPKKNSAPKSAAKPPKAQKKGAPKISPLPGSILRLAEGRKYRKLAEALEGRTSEWGGRRAFLLGYAYLKLDRPADALNLMKRALRRAPELRVHILRFMGTAALAVQDDDAAREALEELIRRDPAGPHAPGALDELAGIEIRRGRPLRAAERLSELLRRFPDHEKAPGFLARRANMLDRAGKKREAAFAWRRLWLRYPESEKADRALEKSRELGVGLKPPLRTIGPRDYFIRARKLHTTYRYEKALKGYRDVSRLFPGSAFRREITVHESLALFSLRRTAKAQTALEEAIYLLSPDSAARAEVRYTLSRNHLRKHDRPAFESEARALLGESPGGKWAAKTRYLLARVSEDDLEYESASRFYQEIIEKHPFSPLAPKARWQLAWIRLRLKDYPGALKGFGELARLHPGSRLVSSAFYWGAVAAERAGEREKAEVLFRKCAQVYRHRYYGHLAKSALRRMAKKSGFEPKPLPLPVAGYRNWSRPPGGFLAESRRLKWRAAEMLASMGLYDLAAREFDRMGSSPYFRYRAALSYSRGERNDMAIRIMHASFWDAVRSGGSDLPQDFWKIAFPLQAKRKRAGEAGPMLVNSIIKAESLFDRLAFSKAGAIGLMQLMPATGRRMAKKLKIRLGTEKRLFNPKLNVRLGARLLGDLVREFKGEIVPAIASYNAGKRVVKKWWAARGKEPIESFIERIPYQETRSYVKKVLGYLEEYRRIYGGSRGAERAEK